jgi:predicted AAA+ superfamily ATPase
MNQVNIPRDSLYGSVQRSLDTQPITALLGPRQCGKTFLAEMISYRFAERHWFDMERPQDLFRLQENPGLLESLQGLIVIDEVQRAPELFPQLRVLADRRFPLARFLILGSASFELVRGASESLAGRVRFISMGGFDLDELTIHDQEQLWLRGGFPKSFLAPDDKESWLWRESFVDTFLMKDIPSYGLVRHGSMLMRRFWTMVADFHGQSWNASKLGAFLSIDSGTVKRYLDILTECYMVRQLPPWTEDVGKRVRRSPKVYLRDSGLLHSLLGIRSTTALQSNAAYGASWEGFAIEHVVRMAGSSYEAYAWETLAGAELDLVLVNGTRRIGFEMKASETPSTTKSMRIAASDLKLERIFVVHPGTNSREVDSMIHVVALRDLKNIVGPFLER